MKKNLLPVASLELDFFFQGDNFFDEAISYFLVNGIKSHSQFPYPISTIYSLPIQQVLKKMDGNIQMLI
jgi:hypothetical protein